MAEIVITQISPTEIVLNYTSQTPLNAGAVNWFVDGAYVTYSDVYAGSYSCGGLLIEISPGVHTISAIYIYTDIYGEPVQAPEISTVFIVGGSGRPSAFSWYVPKVIGGQYYVGASEWGALMDNISSVLTYKGVYYPYTYGKPNVGDTLTAARYNDLRAAIQSVYGYGVYIPLVQKGEAVTAYALNVLVSELNAIP